MQATCGTLPFLWVQTPYSHLASKVRYISHLGHTPNIAEPHAFKQGAVHCLATTWVVTIFASSGGGISVLFCCHSILVETLSYEDLSNYISSNFSPFSLVFSSLILVSSSLILISSSLILVFSKDIPVAPQLWCNCPTTVMQLPHSCGATEISFRKTKVGDFETEVMGRNVAQTPCGVWLSA